jgi:hypothetical protein
LLLEGYADREDASFTLDASDADLPTMRIDGLLDVK